MNEESQNFQFSEEQINLLKDQINKLDAKIDVDRSQFSYIFDDPNKVKKQTDAQYEIYINLTANILENIPGSDFPLSKDLMINNYFIPVPSGNNYVDYISAFVKYIETCIQQSADKASTTKE